MAGIDISKYAHSPVHKAILTRDYAGLRCILESLPCRADPSQIKTEADSIIEEKKADSISAIIDRRDVPNRETPLHLAVKLADATATEMLMTAGADWSLQNEEGWSALQEAICMREVNLAKIIVRHYQPLAWAKWCRRLPRIIATMRRMRDFYMELTFHFESSVIPFISRIAPSDTYRIWKRGSNLRADMTLAGFDGFRIQRSDQSILFLGDGSEDGKVPPGSLCMISHKEKEVVNTLEGAGDPPTEEEIEQEVSAMSQTSIFRPGIDVTQAVLLPQLTWRRQEKSEMVGQWKAKVYDMHHVIVSVKSRRVPGAMTDAEFFSSTNEHDTESEEYEDILTEEEKRQLEIALNMETSDIPVEGLSGNLDGHQHNCHEFREVPIEDVNASSASKSNQDQKRWFSNWGRRSSIDKQEDQEKAVPLRNSYVVNEKVSDLSGDARSTCESSQEGYHNEVSSSRDDGLRKRKGKDSRKATSSPETSSSHKETSHVSEYKKGLRPILWLSPDFPLQTEELLPLLDILANKVKAIRRLRELLTTKLPPKAFPVKVAIPVIPTIRVLVTFTKFEELYPSDKFLTPPSSPESQGPVAQPPSSSWFHWIKTPYRQKHIAISGPDNHVEDIQDPFIIPSDYTWVKPEAKRRDLQEKQKHSRKGRAQKR